MKREQQGVIACDIDDVLADTAPKIIAFSSQAFGTHLMVDEFLEDWPTMWRIYLEEAERRAEIVHGSGIFSELEVVKGSLEALTKARAAGYSIVGATSRPRILKTVTEAWLDEKFAGLFDAVYFSGHFDGERSMTMHLATKRDLYTTLNATVAIDDQPKHCVGAREINIESALLFGDHMWNRSFDCAARGIIRCRDWDAVGERLGLDRIAA